MKQENWSFCFSHKKRVSITSALVGVHMKIRDWSKWDNRITRFFFYKQPGCLGLTRKICPKVKQLAKQPLRVKLKKPSSESWKQPV